MPLGQPYYMRMIPIRVLLLVGALFLTAGSRAADQSKTDSAQEDLVVQTDNVTVSRQRVGPLVNTDYDVTAHVLAVTKTTAWVNAGDVIKIHYTQDDRRKQGVINPPLAMREKTMYHVYLSRNPWNNVYGPAFGGGSFEQVVAKKKPGARSPQSQ